MGTRNDFYSVSVFSILVLLLAACSTGKIQEENNLASTIQAQNSKIEVLSTQIAQQEQTNQSQWENLSHLSTQMPIALAVTTPILEGITITPTPFIDIEYPPSTRTGIDEIDRVIDAFFDNNLDARIELVRYIEYPCTTADGLGGPPKCEAGETDGTIVKAFPVLFSEGTHSRPDRIKEVFDFPVRGLLAVYEVPEDAYGADYWPIGDNAIVFTSEEGTPHTITLHVTDGEIVRLEFNLGWPPFDWIWDRSDTFILPPSTRPAPTP